MSEQEPSQADTSEYEGDDRERLFKDGDTSPDAVTSDNSDGDNAEGQSGLQGKQSVQKYARLCCARAYVYFACIVASIGGVLFGYDIGIIAGALSQLSQEFCLSDGEKEVMVTSLLVGAFLASLVAGFIIDWIGRRMCIVINAAVFIVGAAILTASVVFPMLIVGRVIVGFAVSMSIVAEVAYIAEIAPPKIRGFLIAWNELAIVGGFLLAYIVNLAFVSLPYGWRLMFGLSILPAVVQCILVFFIPNSPRYLVMKGRGQEAIKVLRKLRAGRGGDGVDQEMDEIESDIEQSKKHSVLEIFLPRNNMIFRFIVGAGLCVFQQLTGQSAVLYYAPILFKRLGISGDVSANLATVGLGVAKFLAILVCVLTVDRVGRRRYLLLGTLMMTAALTVVGIVSVATPAIVALQSSNELVCVEVNQSIALGNLTGGHNSSDSGDVEGGDVPLGSVVTVVLAMAVFIAGYELSYGPVTWIVLGEIFPAEVRGRAISIATSLNWLANIVVAVSLLSLLDALHGYTYLLYAFLSFSGFLFILVMLPETKGKSLEQLSKELASRSFFTACSTLKKPFSGSSCDWATSHHRELKTL